MFSRRGNDLSMQGRIFRQTVAGVVGLALVVTLDLHPSAASPEREGDAPWKVTRDKPVPGVNATVKPRKADPAEAKALKAAPKVTWPGKGSAEAAVPQGRARSTEKARAGSLPVWVGPPEARAEGGQTRAENGQTRAEGSQASDDTPAKVRVELLGRRGGALLMRTTRADGETGPGRISLRVSYAAFRHAYGGDWASRLRLVRLPACALTTPAATACAGTPLPTRNNGSGELTADVSVSDSQTLYAVEASSSSTAGDFKASSLSPAASWSVGGSSGDFGWSYPMNTPPGIGGPSTELELSYASGSVDGRTSATNNQPSWVGEGFDFSPGGAIERRYKGCANDTGGNNGTRKTGDLCWGTDNATFVLNGKAGELVRDDSTGRWRPRSDDGSKVERLTGAANGDNGGEYWRITDTDGTQYYFGLNRLPGWASGNEETRSTWTVPVYGNHSGEPCHASTFASSWCKQAYRWNLDYVVDRHGNTMSLFYNTETNHYARNLTSTTVSSYVRAGHVKRIDYGQRHGDVYSALPVGRIILSAAERCIPGSACTTSKPETYPDTPLDQACNSSTNCGTRYNPTFWTQKRLAKVTTQVRKGTGFATVDTWTLRHTFPDPGDGTRPGLWLEAVTQAGHVGGSVTTPEVNFDGVQMANRIDVDGDGYPAMNWWRVSAVHYGTGGEIAVRYSGKECTPTNLPAPDNNGKRCHPQKWTPEGQPERQDWFHKYVVTQVTESDRISGLEPVVTKVDYLTPPAWRFDDEDGLVDTKHKTWGQWRGYGKVRVTKGASGSGPPLVNEYTYFRGMDGDRTASGGTKNVSVTDSTGGTAPDDNSLAGQMREELTYNDGGLVERTITDYWKSAATATRTRSWGTTRAFQVEEAGNRQAETVLGGLRHTRAENKHSATGAVLESTDLGDVSDSSDDTCTRYEYASNPSAGILELPSRRQVVSKACDQAWSNTDVVADERVYYDGSTQFGATPIRGDETKVERLSGFSDTGSPIYQTMFTAEYDTVGRMESFTDALGRTTTRSYHPAGRQPLTKVVDTAANGHVSTVEIEPAWGEEVAVTDPSGRRTDIAYDALGRTSRVWLPGQEKGSDTPHFEYGYLMRADGPGVVTTKSLQADGSIETTYELSDGLMRPRQTQEPAPGGGRIVTDYIYDSRGLEVKENGPYYNDAPPGTDVLIPNEAQLPTQKLTTYDGAERPTAEIFRSYGAEKWRTTHSHTGDRHTVDPPSGEQPTTTITDPEGNPTELREYTTSSPGSSYEKTGYTHNALGQLTSVTDSAGNTWRFGYDLRGRKVREEDPDKGVTTYAYDNADQMVSSTDARGVTLFYTYDEIGRKTSVREGSATGPKRAEWTYDTVATGLPTSATRYVDGNAYTNRVTGYDASGQPTSTQVVIPESEGDLAGVYHFSTTYNDDGEVASRSLPGVGGLQAETLAYGYNAQNLPTTLTGLTTYVRATNYTPFGEPSVVTMYPTGGRWVQRKYEYEPGTRRLSRVVTERATSPRRVANVTYAYDPSGNVTKVTDTPSSLTNEPTDTQCFNYDKLRRLTEAWTPGNGDCAATPTASGLGGPAPYWQKWTFDTTGNRRTQTDTSPTGASQTRDYSYPAAGQKQPHALQSVSTGGTVDSYEYDQAGNTTKRTRDGVTETFAWDAEGNLEQVVKEGAQAQTTSFVYDADGNRLIRRDSSGSTLYMGETELLLTPGGSLVGTRYYEHAGELIGVRVGSTLTWLVPDHHGTPSIAIDAGTQEIERRRIKPYGETRGGSGDLPGQRGFVGGTNDPSTGLVHLGAREYDPSTGRFISVDPIANFEDPQQLHGYAYGNNNPITFSDPDGKLAFIPVAIFVVRMVPVVARVVKHVPKVIKVVRPVLVKVTTQAKNFFSRLFSTVKRWVTKWVTKLVTTFKRVIKRVVKTVKKFVKKRVKKIVMKRVKTPKKRVSRAKKWVKKKFRNTRSTVKRKPRGKAAPKARAHKPKPPQVRKPNRTSRPDRSRSDRGPSGKSANSQPKQPGNSNGPRMRARDRNGDDIFEPPDMSRTRPETRMPDRPIPDEINDPVPMYGSTLAKVGMVGGVFAYFFVRIFGQDK